MGTHILTIHTNTMVAAKLLISLCVAGLSSAAPQNQGAIVSDVVVALQPSIAAAVAEALRGLGGSSSTTRVATSSTGFSSGSSGSRSSEFSSSSSSRGSVSSSAASARAAEPTARPEYSFEFKVADEQEQTFISQNEARDGDDVRGTYSYVDPLGDLITVNYQAGLDGYTQTLDKQVGAVEIRAKPARVSGSTSSSSSQSSSGLSSVRSGAAKVSNNNNNNSKSTFSSRTTSSSSNVGLNQADLIAQIISVLQPQITSAVNTVVAAQ